MGNINMLLAIALPIGAVVLGILGSFFIVVYHLRDMQKCKAKEEQVERLRQEEVKQKQIHLEAGWRVVNSANSNNNSPRLGENLVALSSRLERLGIKLNVNVNGCVENAKR